MSKPKTWLGANDRRARDGAPHGLQGLIDKVYPNGYSVNAVGTHVNESNFD
jgi:hypothetical protein